MVYRHFVLIALSITLLGALSAPLAHSREEQKRSSRAADTPDSNQKDSERAEAKTDPVRERSETATHVHTEACEASHDDTTTDPILRRREMIANFRSHVVQAIPYELGSQIEFALQEGDFVKLNYGDNPFDLTEGLIGISGKPKEAAPIPPDGKGHGGKGYVISCHLWGDGFFETSSAVPLKYNKGVESGGEGWKSYAGCERKNGRFQIKFRIDAKAKKPLADVDKPYPLTKSERIYGLAEVYRMAKQHFAYFNQVPDLDWGQVFMDFLPQVEDEDDLYEYYRVLQRFIALLDDAHTQVYFPPSIYEELDNLPLWLDVIENQWVVIERYPTKEILKEDIPPGTVLESIEGMPPDEYFGERFFPYIAGSNLERKHTVLNWEGKFPKNEKIKVQLLYPDGSRDKRVLRANKKSVEWTSDLLEKYREPFRRKPYFASNMLPGEILHVRYGQCTNRCQSAFQELIVDHRDRWPKGLILDLRGNGGGSTPSPAARRLLSKPMKNMQLKTPWSISYIEARMPSLELSEKFFSVEMRYYGLDEKFSRGWFTPGLSENEEEPLPIHYDGPLVILTDGYTFSAAEGFSDLLKGNGSGTVVGERTFGSTGQPLFFDLPGGGRCRICTIQTRFPDGTEFVGPGIEPDIPVERTIKGIAEGKDEVLEKGLETLKSMIE